MCFREKTSYVILYTQYSSSLSRHRYNQIKHPEDQRQEGADKNDGGRRISPSIRRFHAQMAWRKTPAEMQSEDLNDRYCDCTPAVSGYHCLEEQQVCIHDRRGCSEALLAILKCVVFGVYLLTPPLLTTMRNRMLCEFRD